MLAWVVYRLLLWMANVLIWLTLAMDRCAAVVGKWATRLERYIDQQAVKEQEAAR